MRVLRGYDSVWEGVRVQVSESVRVSTQLRIPCAPIFKVARETIDHKAIVTVSMSHHHFV